MGPHQGDALHDLLSKSVCRFKSENEIAEVRRSRHAFPGA
jgi:hypothetical protein